MAATSAIVSVTTWSEAKEGIIGYLLIGTDNTARHEVEAVQAQLDEVQTIIQMAHSLTMKAKAEGVETAGQLAYLRHHGCAEMQGLLLQPSAPFGGNRKTTD